MTATRMTIAKAATSSTRLSKWYRAKANKRKPTHDNKSATSAKRNRVADARVLSAVAAASPDLMIPPRTRTANTKSTLVPRYNTPASLARLLGEVIWRLPLQTTSSTRAASNLALLLRRHPHSCGQVDAHSDWCGKQQQADCEQHSADGCLAPLGTRVPHRHE